MVLTFLPATDLVLLLLLFGGRKYFLLFQYSAPKRYFFCYCLVPSELDTVLLQSLKARMLTMFVYKFGPLFCEVNVALVAAVLDPKYVNLMLSGKFIDKELLQRVKVVVIDEVTARREMTSGDDDDSDDAGAWSKPIASTPTIIVNDYWDRMETFDYERERIYRAHQVGEGFAHAGDGRGL